LKIDLRIRETIEEGWMIKKTIILLFLAAFLLSSLWPSVQGKIEGIVTDNEGKPLEGVTITIISLKGSAVKLELKSDKNGKFTQVGLWPGYYQVNLKKSGYLPVSREAKVSIAESSKLEVKMEKAEQIIEQSLSKADSLFLKGYKLYEEQKYEEATSAYQEAIKINSTQWGYHFNLGLTYKKLNRREDALAAFQKAAELNPESFSINKELGEVLAKAGNFEEAKKYYKKASELSPDDPDAFYNLGVCLVNSGESEKALRTFLKVVELKPDYADAYYQLGTLSISQNKKEEAVKYLEKFLTLAPEHEKASLARQLLDYLKK
jgi:tetratricopeptide (TPR) repeat protein